MSDGISAALFCSTGPMYTLTEHLLSFSLTLLTACFGKTGCISGFAVHSCERVHNSLKGHKRTCNCDVWAKKTPIVMFVCLFVGMPGCVLLDDVEAWRSIALRKERSRIIVCQLIHWLEHMTTKEQKTEELRMRYWGLIGIAQSSDSACVGEKSYHFSDAHVLSWFEYDPSCFNRTKNIWPSAQRLHVINVTNSLIWLVMYDLKYT